jgi:hypothetical protein
MSQRKVICIAHIEPVACGARYFQVPAKTRIEEESFAERYGCGIIGKGIGWIFR